MYPVFALIAIVLVNFCPFCDGVSKMHSFEKDKAFVDLDCTNGIKLQTYTRVHSDSECIYACVNEATCAGAFYNQALQQCDLVTQIVSDPASCTTLTGNVYLKRLTKYGTPCSSENDCPQKNLACYDGVCRCEHGYSHLPDSGQCVNGDGCNAYSNTFQHNPNFVEPGADFHSEYTYSVNLCKQLCVNPPVPDKVCRAIEFWKSPGKCALTDHTMLEPGSNYQPNQGWDVYTRDCA